MNSRENFLRLLRREAGGYVPRYASFVKDLRDRLVREVGTEDLEGFFGMDVFTGVDRKPPAGHVQADYSAYHPDIEDPSWICPLGVARVPGSTYHFTHIVSPLRHAETLAEIEAFPIDEQEGWNDDAWLAAEVDRLHAEGKIVAGWVGHMYEDAWQIRDNEQFLADLYLNEPFIESILDRLMRRNRARAVAYAKAGVDLLRTGDDVATQNALMFSPEIWRKHFKSRWAQVYEAARGVRPDVPIWYHSDGNIDAIIPELIEIGVTILNPVQPECVDPVKIARTYGDRLGLDGTIGTQTTFPFGTPDEMRRVVRDRIAAIADHAPLILSPTHTLEPEVPIPNILAFFEACESGPLAVFSGKT